MRSILKFVLMLALSGPASGQGYVCVEGGGNPGAGSWAPSVFGWMVDRAEESKGSSRAVVLGLSGSSPAAEEAFLDAGADQVVSVVVDSGNAGSPGIAALIQNADIVWILGGDQSQYIQQWGGALAENAIMSVYNAGGVVGGTSAGAHVMGEVISDALVGSLDPRDALRDAWSPELTLSTGFLGPVDGVLFDTHFTERGRLGRLAVMLARANAGFGPGTVAVGLDDRTALGIHPDGTAEALGSGSVTFLSGPSGWTLDPGAPPSVSGIRHTQITEGYVFDLDSRSVVARPAHADVSAPARPVGAFDEITIRGESLADRTLGTSWADDRGSEFALFDGALTLEPGSGALPGVVLSTRAWASLAFDENRVGGALWALQEAPIALAVWLDDGARLAASAPSILTALPSSGPQTSALVLDARNAVSTAQSTLFTSSDFSVGPRQSVAIEGATLHVLAPGDSIDLSDPVPCSSADFAEPLGTLDFNDVLGFLTAFGADDPAADLAPPTGILDFNDVIAFLTLFSAGCP